MAILGLEADKSQGSSRKRPAVTVLLMAGSFGSIGSIEVGLAKAGYFVLPNLLDKAWTSGWTLACRLACGLSKLCNGMEG
jgi:hypothetical protein